MSEEKLTMDDFSAELEASFKKIEEGDMLTGTVISVDEKEVILDLKYYAEGVIRAEDFSNEPGFIHAKKPPVFHAGRLFA